MKNVLKDIVTPETRRWLYGVVVASLPILGYFGLVTEELGFMIAGFAASFLALTVASGNLPDKDREMERDVAEEIVHEIFPSSTVPDSEEAVKPRRAVGYWWEDEEA